MHPAFRPSDAVVLHLTDGLAMNVVDATPELWRDRECVELTTGRMLSIFSYDATWDYQERHPDGDELALVLEGAVDLLLDAGDGEHAVRVDRGEACLIPQGAWHRVAVREPSTILFVTPVPARTEHRSTTGA